MPSQRTLRIIGGGITGLAAALEASADERTRVEVFEASNRWGGKIRTETFRQRSLDEGADSFLLRVPEAKALCEEIGVEYTHPATAEASIHLDGRLVGIPKGTVLGAPAYFDELEASGALSPEGLERAKAEPSLPGMPIDGDRSIESFIADRYGIEVSKSLVEPLIGGIYGGLCRELSLDAVLPQLAAIAHDATALVPRLQAQLDSAASSSPVFGGPVGGMQTLIDAMVDTLEARGVDMCLNTPAESLDPSVRTVVATAGPNTGGLVAPLSVRSAEILDAIQWSGVVLVCLALDRTYVGEAVTGSGFLVPRDIGNHITAVSWSSHKWAGLDLGDNELIARVSLGHSGDQAPLGWDDQRLRDTVLDELTAIVGPLGDPLEVKVVRYPAGFPQYTVGHLQRIGEVDRYMAQDASRAIVTGSAHRGVGIPACIRQGRAAVRELLSRG